MSISRLERIDRYGHCVFCTKNMIVKRVVDGKVIDMFTPDHDHTEFMLDSGSIMKVCMCKKCKENVDLSRPVIHKMIMDAVQRGWELETKTLIASEAHPDWTEEFGAKYLETMAKLNIDCHSSNMDKNALEVRRKELINPDVEEIKVEVTAEDIKKEEVSIVFDSNT